MTETIGPMEGNTVEGMHGSKIDPNAYGIRIYSDMSFRPSRHVWAYG